LSKKPYQSDASGHYTLTSRTVESSAMPTARVRAVLGHISQLVGTPPAGDLTDGQLLQRYVSGREKAAFTALLQRHGRLVWGVCRHVLHHDQDAEDAFQATFLVLAHKAGSIRKQESVAGWLYGVAYRTAMKAKTNAAKRRAHEKWASHGAPEEPPAKAAWRELLALLDHELNRLPEKYRAPFVLCCLEGKSRSEAARALGWKEGTVAGRLGQARKLLQHRLARRSVTLSAVLCVAALSEQALQAAVPARLLTTAADAALLFAAGQGAPVTALSAPVIALAKGVLRAMTLSKLKAAMVLLLTAGVAFAVAGMVVHKAFASTTVEAKAEDEPKPLTKSAGQPNLEAAKTVRTDRYGDPLPPQAVARIGTVRWWHGRQGGPMVYAPDGKSLVSCDQNKGIRIVDTATGKESRRIEVQGESISCFALSPDGKTIITGSGESPVLRQWDVSTGKGLRQIATGAKDTSVLAFSSNGKTLAAVTGQTDIRLWDVATWKETHQLKGHTRWIGSVLFSPDGKTLVSGGGITQTMRWWDVGTGREIKRLNDVPAPLGTGLITGWQVARRSQVFQRVVPMGRNHRGRNQSDQPR
jgi:RNA polymerase sigma factor (sigma-70 family)